MHHKLGKASFKTTDICCYLKNTNKRCYLLFTFPFRPILTETQPKVVGVKEKYGMILKNATSQKDTHKKYFLIPVFYQCISLQVWNINYCIIMQTITIKYISTPTEKEKLFNVSMSFYKPKTSFFSLEHPVLLKVEKHVSDV